MHRYLRLLNAHVILRDKYRGSSRVSSELDLHVCTEYNANMYFETNNESVNRGIRGLEVGQPGGWFVSRNNQRIRDCWTCSETTLYLSCRGEEPLTQCAYAKPIISAKVLAAEHQQA